MHFANLDIETSNKDISKTVTASCLRYNQLKKVNRLAGEQDTGQANGWGYSVS